MQIGKQKPAFRLKITEVKTNKSKSITIYEGEEQKTLTELITNIIEYLRKKD